MIKKIIKYVLVILLMVAYGVLTYRQDHQGITGNVPVIEVPSGTLKLKTSAKESDILKGVKATDQEDGDLTSKIFIESLSTFGENNVRQVTIGVFDSDDNLTRVSRSIQYTNYTKPTISLKKALIFTYVSSKAQFADYVSARSSVDGDISSNITVLRQYIENGETYVQFQARDTTGTKTQLTLKADSNTREQALTINLTDYLIHIKKGEVVRPLSYIDSIMMGTIDQTLAYRSQVVCTPSTFRATSSGMYEIYYQLKTQTDDYGVTKLVIIVD